jgi:iron complex transport system substrate-binding protein
LATSASSTATASPAAAASAALLSLLLLAAPAAAEPRRVASINLCTDQIALLLLPRERIASVSFLADDPALSFAAPLARGIPKNRAQAEEILAVAPDLVLADIYANQAAAGLLRHAGLPLWFHTPAATQADIETTWRAAGEVLGVAPRASELIEQMTRRLAAVTAQKSQTAAIFFPNAWAMGSGTLADSALRAAGYRNAVSGSGYAAYSLETLLQLKPEVLVLPREDTPTFSQAAALLDHPAARGLWPAERRINLPGHLLICGGPFFADAVERLAR